MNCTCDDEIARVVKCPQHGARFIVRSERDEAAAYERGRLAGIEEGRAAERADVVVADKRDAARADAARLASALRLALSVANDCQQRWSRGHPARVKDATEALAAHDAGTPTGGVWLTAEEVESLRGLLDYSADDVEEQARSAFDKMRKARGGGA